MINVDARTMAGVESRGRTGQLLRDSLSAALAEARANPHPWYRCQSLTHVAALIDEPVQAAEVLQEALDAARELDEPNRIVFVSAWPISVIVQRAIGDVSEVVEELLQVISCEPNPIRRADALLLLLEAVMSHGLLRHMVLGPLLAACTESRGWKGRRILQDTALAVATESGRVAQHVLSLIPESREARRTKRMLQRREWLGPHRFVPYYVKR